MNKGCSGEGKEVPRALLEEAGHSGIWVEVSGKEVREIRPQGERQLDVATGGSVFRRPELNIYGKR